MARGPLPPLALVYHGVAKVPLGQDPDALFVAPTDLRRQIARLREWDYRLVSFGELAEEVAGGGGHARLLTTSVLTETGTHHPRKRRNILLTRVQARGQ